MRVMIDGTRYDISGMRALGVSTTERQGVSVTEVYYGPRSHRLIIQGDSVWDRGDGRCVGETWQVFEPGDAGYGQQIEWLQRRHGIELDDAPVPTVSEPASG